MKFGPERRKWVSTVLTGFGAAGLTLCLVRPALDPTVTFAFSAVWGTPLSIVFLWAAFYIVGTIDEE